ncbi:MAG: DEAD/DEAH box helicase family protein [Nitrospirae bacterium]|nr:DEAD/DEAH box helicase family protein [Nitrospirota bacterium]
MLLDNKTKKEDNEPSTVYDFLRNYIEHGKVDIVTGYFSVSALARIKDEMNGPERFRMVLGNLLREDNQQDKVINLLSDSLGIAQVLNLNQSAKRAVDFLRQEKVQVKTIQRNFCHAKTYMYYDPDTRKNFHIIGSSNLTDAGLGIRASGNIELNSASTGNDNDFRELTTWFKDLWSSNDALATIELPDKSKVSVKEHIINFIQNLYRKYTPFELYYKVLYELFKEDLLSLSLDPEFKKEISHLEDTLIYKILYSFQKTGVISLIKMLQKNNGAILADAVGLGKTWTALAVMKYFEMKGFRVILLCPKKLDANWRQYLEGHRSKFERDRLKYTIRYHTDLQDDRLESYQDGYKINTFFQGNPKLLVVIDESHNLRNDKSSRYKFLVDNILTRNKEVKVLQLSATPINNKLIDVRNQFKLIVKGQDNGFKETSLEIGSLESIFRTAQKDFKTWQDKDNRKISDFIKMLPQKFFSLTDALIVARTRKLIESEFGGMSFPKKEDPENEYINPENIGNLKTFEELLHAIESINLIAYMPHKYTEKIAPESVLKDEVQREGFLVKMMYILLMKRLESSWHSFKNTVNNIYAHHTNALQKVSNFKDRKEDTVLEDEISEQNNFEDDLEETSAEFTGSYDETEQLEEFTLGKKNPINLSDIRHIDMFKRHLEDDIARLEKLKSNLDIFEQDLKEKKIKDIKLERLVEHIEKKRRAHENQKVIVFTVFTDTAQYLYGQLFAKGFSRIAYVSGSQSATSYGYSGKIFEGILERFAPYTKLYKEKDWNYLYEEKGVPAPESFGDWKDIIKKHDPDTLRKLEEPLDILIATDCLSEGQNLQDCDCVINYDIHWNPVRIIQRMGRIDRLGSPNQTIKGINFWPGKNYEDYLRLKTRVENRMAAMSIVGAEIDEKMTPEIEKMVKDNPIVTRQTEKMLNQMQFTWEDVETSDESLGLNDLSLEQFRQELFDIFQKNKEFFEKMPNGIFTGFQAEPDKKYTELPEGIIALLGHPKKPDDADMHKYNEYHLLYSHAKGISTYNNNQEILSILRKHKNKIRLVPADVENGDKEALQWLSDRIKAWIEGQAPQKAIDEIQGIFADGVPKKKSPEEKKLEDKFKPDNFDLITWFVISE